jgi:hypothetical protein
MQACSGTPAELFGSKGQQSSAACKHMSHHLIPQQEPQNLQLQQGYVQRFKQDSCIQHFAALPVGAL